MSKDRKLAVVADAPNETPAIERKELTITSEGWELLSRANSAVAQAQAELNVIFTGICAGAGVSGARLVGADAATRKLTVEYPVSPD